MKGLFDREGPDLRPLAKAGEGVDRHEETESEEEELPGMPVTQHLEDLRKFLFHAFGALLLAFFLCWGLAPQIYRILSRPIVKLLGEDGRLAIFAVTDAFVIYAKVALLAGIFLSAPYILYRFWVFLRPALRRHERRMAIPFIFVSTFFFLAGGAFAYFVAFPFAVEWLLSLGEDFEAVISAQAYLRFLMTIMLGLGLMFELPVLLVVLSALGLVTPKGLLAKFRWAVLVIFIVAAVVTPTPDPFNLFLFAVPSIFLYLLGIAGSALVYRRRRLREAGSEAS